MTEWEKLLDVATLEEHEILMRMFGGFPLVGSSEKENWFDQKRHHYEKRLVKAKEIVVRWGRPIEFAPYYANNLAKCGCWMCTNPRRGSLNRSERITLQEKRSDVAYRQQLREVNYG